MDGGGGGIVAASFLWASECAPTLGWVDGAAGRWGGNAGWVNDTGWVTGLLVCWVAGYWITGLLVSWVTGLLGYWFTEFVG